MNVRCFSFGPKTGLMRRKWAQTKGKWHSTVGMVSPSSAGLLLQWEVERQSHPLPVQVSTQWSWCASLETVQPSPGIRGPREPAGPKMERAGTPSKWFPSYSALLFFVLVNTVELEIGWTYFHSPTLYLIESWLEKTQVGLFCSLLVQYKLELCWGGHNVSQHILPEANLSEN